MTKEEIQAQIELYKRFKSYMVSDRQITADISKLKRILEKSISIQDLQREAFEAGRDCTKYSKLFRYETFEEYLKTLKDEKIRKD
jgi:hypothetical protein